MEQTVSVLEDNPKRPKLMIYAREIFLGGGNIHCIIQQPQG